MQKHREEDRDEGLLTLSDAITKPVSGLALTLSRAINNALLNPFVIMFSLLNSIKQQNWILLLYVFKNKYFLCNLFSNFLFCSTSLAYDLS